MRRNFLFVFLLIAANVGISVKEANGALFDLNEALDIFGENTDISKQAIVVEAIKMILGELVDFLACDDWECKYLAVNKIVYELVLLVRRLTEEENNIHPRLRRYVEEINISLKQLAKRDLERRKRNGFFKPKLFNFISDEADNVQGHLNTAGGIIRQESNNVRNFLRQLVPVKIPISRNKNANKDDDQVFIDDQSSSEPKDSGNRFLVPIKGQLEAEDNVLVEIDAPESREVVVVIDDDQDNVHDIKS